MAEIDFSFRSLVSRDIHPEAGIFHTVEGKMLYAGNNAFILHALHESRCHSADMNGILAVGLLASASAGIVGYIYTNTAVEITAVCSYFLCYGASDSFLKLRVKGSASCHRNREAGGLTAYTASGTVTEKHLRNTEPLISAGTVRYGIV